MPWAPWPFISLSAANYAPRVYSDIMGANCGKDEAASAGFTSSTAVERSVSRIKKEQEGNASFRGAGVKGQKSEVKGGSTATGGNESGQNSPIIKRQLTPEKTTKALRGKALLAACMLTDEDEDDDFVDFNDDKRRPNIPGLISDSPTATERERRAEKNRRSTPDNSGSRRRSKR